MPTLCETFRYQAGFVWRNMQNAAAMGLQLSEETITEWVQYQIALAHQGAGFVVDLATKRQEGKHGADWEWWFIKRNKTYKFRVQAKRLFGSTHRYLHLLSGPPDRYFQLNKLVRNASKAQMVPLYCFYNFAHWPNEFGSMLNPCDHPYHPPSFWGCTLAFPRAIKRAGTDELNKLKERMSPWHALVCDAGTNDLLSSVFNFVRLGDPTQPLEASAIPPRIQHLIELGNERRRSQTGFVPDDSHWRAASAGATEGIAGIVVYRDVRD